MTSKHGSRIHTKMQDYKMLQREKKITPEERAILTLRLAKFSYRKIAELLHSTKSKAYRVVKKFGGTF